MKTILITGGTGFLGSYLIKKLLYCNNIIIILKRSFSDISRIKDIINNKNIIIYDIDLLNLEEIFRNNKIDYIFHTATNYGRNGETLTQIVDSNLNFPLKLLELGELYNVETFYNVDTTLPNGLNYYVISKKQFLEYGNKISSNGITNFVNFKLEHIYGPGDDNKKFVGMIIGNILNGNKEIDLTLGEQERDFIYIDDVINMFLYILKNRSKGGFKEYNIGTGKTITIKNIVLKIKELMNSDINLNFGKISYREGEQMYSCANLDNIFKNYKFISVDEGLKNIIDNLK